MLTRRAIVLVSVLAHAQAAHAQSDEAGRLYEEGKALVDAGKPLEACEKFEQSFTLDSRQVGVLLQLGRCNERTGKIATAVKLYRQTIDRAREASLNATLDAAQKLLDAVLPDVPLLLLEHAAPRAPGEKIVVDDVVETDSELLLDPGRHQVVVTAPGRLPFEQTVELRKRERRVVQIPALELPTHTSSIRRPAGKVLVITGLVTMTVGGGLVVYAKHDYDGLFAGSSPHCGRYPDVDGQPTCDSVGQRRADRDHTFGTAGAVIGALGAVAVGTGVALWVTAPHDVAVAPMAGGGTLGVVAAGTF